MKHTLAIPLLTVITALSGAAQAQFRILPTVEFRKLPEQNLRGNLSSGPGVNGLILVTAADFPETPYSWNGKNLKNRNWDSGHSIQITAIKESGLKMNISYRKTYYKVDNDGDRLTEERHVYYTGEATLENCYKNKVAVFKRSTTVADVFQQVSNSRNMEFDTCIIAAKELQSNFTTPGGNRPYDYLENVRIELSPQAVKMKVQHNGKSLELPYMYFNDQHSGNSNVVLQEVKSKLLTILDGALSALDADDRRGDIQLSQTVAYLMEQRPLYTAELAKLKGQDGISGTDLVNFLVTIKNAFHNLDQAVGLASKNQVQLGQLMGVSIDGVK